MSMLLRSPRATRTVYRLRAGKSTDLRGEETESWESSSRAPLKRASVQSASTDEEAGTRRLLRDERRLYLPYAADLRASDRVEINGEVWRVEGDPVVRDDGLSQAVYTTADLRRLSDGKDPA